MSHQFPTVPAPSSQPGPVVMYHHVVQQTNEELYSKSKCGTIRRIGISQLIMGAMMILFGIVSTTLRLERDNYYEYYGFTGITGSGIWVGLLLAITGVVTVNAGIANRFRLITACMVLNIICTVFMGYMIILTAMGVAFNKGQCSCRGFSGLHCNNCNKFNAILAMDALLLVPAAIQFCITIACSAICCGAVCCRIRPPASMVQYHPAPGTFQPMNVDQRGQATPMYFAAAQQQAFPAQGQAGSWFQAPPTTAYNSGYNHQFANTAEQTQDNKPPPYEEL